MSRRILLRSGKDPFLAVSAEETLERNLLGDNSGNALFATSVHEMLSRPDTTVVSDGFRTQKFGDAKMPVAEIAGLNETYDAFVLPMANAFRPTFGRNLSMLTRVIERLDMPVVVVGIGAQLPPDNPGIHPSDQSSETIVRFLRAVLDRSPAIGVRGEITRAYLRSLGFGDEHVEVIGCPSLSARSGPEVVKRTEALGPDSPLAMNLTPSVAGLGEFVERQVRDYRDLVFVAQTNRTLALMLWGEDYVPSLDPRLPYRVDHPLYRRGQMRHFVDPQTWVDYLATRDFSFGTRIHGNIAALMAGTPAVVLSFDSRTKELAEYHEIPHRRATPDFLASTDAADLYRDADFTAFNAGRASRRTRLADFLRRAGVEVAQECGPDADHRELQRERVTLASPVIPLTAETPHGQIELARRLRWLRQQAADQRVDDLTAEVATLRRQVRALRRRQGPPAPQGGAQAPRVWHRPPRSLLRRRRSDPDSSGV